MSALEEIFSGFIEDAESGVVYDCVVGGHPPRTDKWEHGPKRYAKFEESQHPRGQPENAGQFVKGGGSSASEFVTEDDIDAVMADYKEHGTHAKAFLDWFGDWVNDAANASKVVNDEGEPQETYSIGKPGKPTSPKSVFHGTQNHIESFDKDRINIALYGYGFYFTESPDVAKAYANKGESQSKEVDECYLNIRNPLNLEEEITKDELVKLCDEFDKWAKDNGKDYSFIAKQKTWSTATWIKDSSSYSDIVDHWTEKEGNYFVGDFFETINLAFRPGSSPQKDVTEFLKTLGYDGVYRRDTYVPGKGYHQEPATTWIAFEPEQIKAVDNRGTFDPKDPRIKYAKWDESKHPRGGKGTKEGGRFVKGSGTATVDEDAELHHEGIDQEVPADHHWADDDLGEYEDDEADREHSKANENYAQLMKRLADPDGGFSYQPYYDEEPKTGYMVSPYPERSKVITVHDLKPVDLVKYILDNAEFLKDKNHFVGAWHNPKDEKVYLDVSVRTDTPEEAEKLCLDHDQIAYFDLNEMRSVEVNPNATSGQKPEKVLLDDLQQTVEKESLGIDRDKMPQLRGQDKQGNRIDASDEFVEHLKKKGVRVWETSMKASELKPSQGELDLNRVQELVSKDTGKKKIFVTQDNYILDGHHHWASRMIKGELDGDDPKIKVYKIGMDFEAAYDEAKRFAKQAGIQPKSV